jgi:hypothetical protein
VEGLEAPPGERTQRLRIVLATYALDQPGGTETYALTVAHELRRLGHEVTLSAEELGAVAAIARRDGLQVARLPSELPVACDVALVQDGIVTAPLADRYPDVALVHVAHSPIFDHQLPVLVPRVIDAVVALSERVASRIRALALDAPVVRLRQPIDTERFASAGPLPERPRRALLLGNYLRGARQAALVAAWSSAGIECFQVGGPDRLQHDVREAIAAADIVVAKGRAALEGMACARAVYVYDDFGGDGWVTAATYEPFEADGFAGVATPRPRTRDDLAADLSEYHPDMGWVNRELIVTHHRAREHAAELVEVLRGSARAAAHGTARSTAPRSADVDEVSRLTRLLWHAERETVGFQRQTEATAARVLSAEQDAAVWKSRAVEAEARLNITESRLNDAQNQLGHAEHRLNDVQRRLDDAHGLLSTRRVQAGLALGRLLDRGRGRR